MSNVKNIFVGNGSALETTVNTLTPGKLGVFGKDQTILAGAYLAGGIGGASGTEEIQFSETFADGSSKKSMRIDGRNVTGAYGKRYTPATREVWAIGYQRGYTDPAGNVIAGAGLISVTPSVEYGFTIIFKNDKSFYSERQEVLRGSFISSSVATQLTIATQIAGVINGGAFKSQIAAIVVGNGTGVYGLTAATAWGVEITALDINQFPTTTYKENRVAFTVAVNDNLGFGSATTCIQVQANDPGIGTYKSIYNKENFDYQFEGLINRIKFPVQAVSFNASNAGVLTGTVAGTGNVGVTINSDIVTFVTTNAMLRAGELVSIDGTMYEIKYLINTTTAVLTVPFVGATNATAVLLAKLFYNTIVISFTDNSFIAGAGFMSAAKKLVMVATPSIVAAGTMASIANGSTEGIALLSKLNAWLATTPTAPVLTYAV